MMPGSVWRPRGRALTGPIGLRNLCGVLWVDRNWGEMRRIRGVPAKNNTYADAGAVSSQRIRSELGVAPQDACVSVCRVTVLETQRTDDL